MLPSFVLLQQMDQPLLAKDVVGALLRAVSIVGVAIGAIAGLIGFFLKRYWDVRDKRAASRERKRANMREVLYESLKWFEGGTQKRSIGIAVVDASWKDFKEFHPMWVEVFANQAIYLLLESKNMAVAHELDNLRRLLEKLLDSDVDLKIHTAKNLTAAIRQVCADTSANRRLLREAAEPWLEPAQMKLTELERLAELRRKAPSTHPSPVGKSDESAAV
jgi:hypothetical protein